MSVIGFVFIGFGLLAAPLFVVLLREKRVGAAMAVLLPLLLVNAGGAVIGGLGHWMAAFPLPGFSLLAMVFSAVVLFRQARAAFDDFAGASRLRWLYGLGGLLILMMQALPLAGAGAVQEICFAQTRDRAAGIITAAELFQKDEGSYPVDLAALVPGYLSRVETPFCGGNFKLYDCEGVTLLAADTPGQDGVWRYNFQTGQWTGIDTLDFSVCQLLE